MRCGYGKWKFRKTISSCYHNYYHHDYLPTLWVSEFSICAYWHVVCVSGKCSQWIKRSGWPVFPSLIAFFSYIAGDYSPQSLLEMIALHLDAVFVEHDTWREFALCFLKVSRCEEDEMSVCLHGNEGEKRQSYSFCYNGIPKMFTHGKSVGLWRSRCRWWSTRHFSKSILASEIDVGTYLSSL